MINNTSSTSKKIQVKKIEPSILVSRAAMFEETIGIWIRSINLRRPEQSKKVILRDDEKYFYNEEFDPGSGWTLATGLTHASRGAAF